MHPVAGMQKAVADLKSCELSEGNSWHEAAGPPRKSPTRTSSLFLPLFFLSREIK